VQGAGRRACNGFLFFSAVKKDVEYVFYSVGWSVTFKWRVWQHQTNRLTSLTTKRQTMVPLGGAGAETLRSAAWV
jgi:hypothetical protein